MTLYIGINTPLDEMNRNDNPLFTMIPSSVLAKVKALADEFRAQENFEELVWRHLGLVIVGLGLIFAFNIANGFTFSAAFCEVFATSESLKRTAWIYGACIILGGLLFSANAFFAWLELISFRRENRLPKPPLKKQRLFRAATWVPVLPLVVLPAFFNALFSTQYFFALVSIAFVVMIGIVVVSDV